MQRFNNSGTTPVSIGSASVSYEYLHSGSDTKKVYLTENTCWSHISAYCGSNAGDGGGGSCSATAYFKSGASPVTILSVSKYGGYKQYQPYYIGNYLSASQIDDIDYILCYVHADNTKGGCTSWASVGVYGLPTPWISE